MKKTLLIVCLASVSGFAACSWSPTGPSDVPTPGTIVPNAGSTLTVPSQLRGVWGTADQALERAGRYQANVVILQIDAWNEDLTPTASSLRARGIGAMAFVQQVFEAPRSSWDAGWERVERWARPLKDAGILWGFHVFDEPATRGQHPLAVEAIAYVRARGYDVFHTEWIDYVTDQRKDPVPRPPGVRWYGVTCYDYGSPRAKWHIQNCAEEYARHPGWDTVIGQGFDAGNGMPDPKRWEQIAAGRSLVWWIDP